MGAWGTGVLDNDGAGDFLIAVESNPACITDQVAYIQDTLADEDYMEVDEGSTSLALGELILIAYGVHPVHPLVENIGLEAVKSQITPEFLQQIISVIQVTLNMDDSNRSEVYELWEEANPEDFAQWKQIGQTILTKLEQLNLPSE